MIFRRKRLHCVSDEDYEMTYCNQDKILFYESKHINDTLYNLSMWNAFFVDKFLTMMKNNDPVFLTNKKGHVLFVSQEWCNISEYEEQDILGRKFNLLQGEKTDKYKCHQFVAELNSFDRASMIIVNYTKSGNPIRVYIETERIKMSTPTPRSRNMDYDLLPFYMGFIDKVNDK